MSELKEWSCDNPVPTIVSHSVSPLKCIKRQIEDTMPASLQEAIKFYEGDLPSASMMPVEYRMYMGEEVASATGNIQGRPSQEVGRRLQPL